MGSSGSGKSSFLDLLANRVQQSKTSGEILFNGKSASSDTRKRLVSYVAQEDTLLGQLSVEETLGFAARFHFGFTLSQAEFEREVDVAISRMGLGECRHTLVGDIFRKGISGGQKRRLSIAVELIARAPVLLLDEPTSGLDSASAYGVVYHLRELAVVKHHTILTTIHQPSSECFSLFSTVMLLSKGRTVFFGPRASATSFFSRMGHVCPEHYNPADFFLGLMNTDFKQFGVQDTNAVVDVGALADSFTKGPDYTEVMKQIDEFEVRICHFNLVRLMQAPLA
jgi:ABC-type multidrug transport system ATPase subunit